MAINSEFTAGQVLTAAQQNALPFGIVNIATLATTFNSTSTSRVDITGLSTTFTAVANRRYLVTLYGAGNNNGNNVTQIYLMSDSTDIAELYFIALTNTVQTLTTFAMITPGAGSVTIKTQIINAAGQGTIYGTSTRASLASRIAVFDMGNT